jgi:hypothetical protein
MAANWGVPSSLLAAKLARSAFSNAAICDDGTVEASIANLLTRLIKEFACTQKTII